jgi:hypothetical protein
VALDRGRVRLFAKLLHHTHVPNRQRRKYKLFVVLRGLFNEVTANEGKDNA